MSKLFFQSDSTIETDSSQNGILNSINSTGRCLIQYSVGNDKDRTLNSVLVKALENHKKTMVVCEKTTELDVIHNILKDAGFGDQCLLINDVELDRETALNSVQWSHRSRRSYF